MKSRILIFALIVSVLTACGPSANSATSQNGIEIEQARIVVPGSATPMAGMAMGIRTFSCRLSDHQKHGFCRRSAAQRQRRFCRYGDVA